LNHESLAALSHPLKASMRLLNHESLAALHDPLKVDCLTNECFDALSDP
jgi:hypothetical protein